MHFDALAVISLFLFLIPQAMQPTPAIYPSFGLKNTPSFSQDLSGNNPTPCKPVAIISHGTEITLVTCSKSVSTAGAQARCHHSEYESHSLLPLAPLIKDLQHRGCSVYTRNSADGTFSDRLPALSHDDLAEEMETSDAAFVATPQDLEAHPFDENALLQLLPPEAINPLLFTQQEAATSRGSTNASSQPSSSSAPALNLPLPTADTRSTQAALVHATTSQTDAAESSQQPSTSAAPSANRDELNRVLAILPRHERRKISCILSVLNSASEPLSRHECIRAMIARYPDLRNITAHSSYSTSFATAVRLGLIEKVGYVNNLGGVKYRILPTGVNFISNP